MALVIKPFLILLFFLSLLTRLSAERSNISLLQEGASYEYGLSLLNQGDCYRSITEFKRYLFFSTSLIKKEKAEYGIGLCYLQGKEYQNARQVFQKIYDTPGHSEASFSLLGIADSYFYEEKDQLRLIQDLYDENTRSFFSSEYYLHYIKEFKDTRDFNPEVYLKLSTIKALDFNEEKAYSFLSQYSTTNQVLRQKMSRFEQKIRERKNLPSRSKTAAFLLSFFIPGLGQIYAGDVREGLIALGVNSLMITGTYYSYTRYSQTLGLILGYYSLIFYIGNVNNAVQAVHRFNENQKIVYQQEIAKIFF